MATRTAWAGTATDGTMLDEGDTDSLPGGWIGSVTATSTQSGINSEVDITGLSVTVTVGANRRLLIIAHCPAVECTVASGRIILRIKESSTVLDSAIQEIPRTGASFASVTAFAEVTPSAGSHTYKCTANSDQGGDVTLNNTSTATSRLMVIDIGPA